MKTQKPTRFLYVIGSGSERRPLKIGVASDVEQRLVSLQTTSCPYKLKVLLSIELAPEVVRKVETACHAKLKNKRLHGEWFDVDFDLAVSVIESVIEHKSWEQTQLPKLLKPRKRKDNIRDDMISFRTSPDFAANIKALATAEGISLSRWIERAAIRKAKALTWLFNEQEAAP